MLKYSDGQRVTSVPVAINAQVKYQGFQIWRRLIIPNQNGNSNAKTKFIGNIVEIFLNPLETIFDEEKLITDWSKNKNKLSKSGAFQKDKQCPH